MRNSQFDCIQIGVGESNGVNFEAVDDSSPTIQQHLLDQESQVHCLILLWVIDLVSVHGGPYVMQVCS
jgi:hypothetical protein